MVSTGHALDLRKLMVYPIPHGELFTLEVLLRITAAIEMMLMVLGAATGILFNRSVPFWGALGLLSFIAMNLFLAAGLRDLIGRLLARKGIRELVVILI